MSEPPAIRYRSIDVAARPWRMRLPFHYGVVTLHEAVELQLACAIEIDGRGVHTGYSAELAAPKWFNKDPALTPDDTVARLREVVAQVVALALDAGRAPASFAAVSETIEQAARAALDERFNDLEISYALALVERATIDALCRALDRGFPQFLAGDGLGLRRMWPHGADFAIDRWLAALRPVGAIAVRHTVGLSDPLTRADVAEAMIGGRPVALADVVAFDHVRHFKIKIADDDGEVARLERLTAVLVAACPDFVATLDANEAFTDVDRFAAVMAAFAAAPALAPLWARVRYIEQPFDRHIALDRDVRALSAIKPLLIDESDDRGPAFAEALARGYRGVSIKTCKGIRRAVTNAALAARETGQGRPAFISAEDLSVPPGVALQQNIVLAATLGVRDAERNGHHFGPGPRALPASERADFIARHPDVYGAEAILIEGGAISARSALAARGFGTEVRPRMAPA